MDVKKFGERIKKLRYENNMTQHALAEQIGMTPTGICYWEAGRALPSLATVLELADIFNVSIDYLIGNEDYKIDEYENLIKKIKKVDSNKQRLMLSLLNNVVDTFINESNKK